MSRREFERSRRSRESSRQSSVVSRGEEDSVEPVE